MGKPASALTVRAATEGDADAIAALNLQVQALHHEAEPHRYKPPAMEAIGETVRARFAHPEAHYLVAALPDGTVVGYLLLIEQRSADTPFAIAERYVELDQIAVRPDHQRCGVARALSHEAGQWARARGCKTLRLTVRSVNTGAQGAYEALGYRPEQQRMMLRLDS